MKNLVFFITCMFLGITSSAQTNIRLIIKSNQKIDSVGIIDISQKEFYQCPFKDTIDFRFNKNNIDLYNIRYFISGKLHRKQLWLDTGNVTVKAHTADDDLVIDTALSSPVYYDVITYLHRPAKLQTKQDTLLENDFRLAEIQKNLENPRSIAIANDFVNLNQNNKNELLRLKTLLSKQKTDFSWFLFYSMGIERMNKILSLKKIQFSDFKFINRQNKIAPITSDACDYCILDFWFVGCTSCAQQHKTIKQDYQKLNDKKIAVIGISTDPSFKIWISYLAKHNYKWSNYLETGSSKLSHYLGIKEFPAYVVVNKKGEIIGNYDSWDSAMNVLNR